MNHEDSVLHRSELAGDDIGYLPMMDESTIAQPATYHEAVARALKGSVDEFLRAKMQSQDSGDFQASQSLGKDKTSSPGSSPSTELLDVKDSLGGFGGMLESDASRPQAANAVESQGAQTGRDSNSRDSRGLPAVPLAEPTVSRSPGETRGVVEDLVSRDAGGASSGASSNFAMIRPENSLSHRMDALGIADRSGSLIGNVEGALTADGSGISAQPVLNSSAYRLGTSEWAGVATPFAEGILSRQPSTEGAVPSARVDPLVVNVDRSSLGFGGFESLLNGDNPSNQAGTALGWGGLSDSGGLGENASETYGGSPRATMSPGETTNTAGVDLSKTNELLQQLLEEVRRGRTPFLPLNDRN